MSATFATSSSTTVASPRRFSLAMLLWLLGFCGFGLCGLHRIYVGRRVSGLVYLFTFGLFGVGQILDFVRVGGMVRRANARRGG